MTDWSLARAGCATFFWPSSNSFRLQTCSEEERFFLPPWSFGATVGAANLSRRSTSSGSPIWLYSAPSAITNNHFHENDQSHPDHHCLSSAAAQRHTSLCAAFLDCTRQSYCCAWKVTTSLPNTLIVVVNYLLTYLLTYNNAGTDNVCTVTSTEWANEQSLMSHSKFNRSLHSKTIRTSKSNAINSTDRQAWKMRQIHYRQFCHTAHMSPYYNQGSKYNFRGGATVQLSGPPSSFPGPLHSLSPCFNSELSNYPWSTECIKHNFMFFSILL